jgi:hypothetical protein
MTNKLNLTWRQVLDSYAPNSNIWEINKFMELVNKAGYEYFNWNGKIYKLHLIHGRSLFCDDIGLTVSDLN